MTEYKSTFVKYPEREILKVVKSDRYDAHNHILRHENKIFDSLPTNELIIEFRVARMLGDDGKLLSETHLLHQVFNLNALEEIKKL